MQGHRPVSSIFNLRAGRGPFELFRPVAQPYSRTGHVADGRTPDGRPRGTTVRAGPGRPLPDRGRGRLHGPGRAVRPAPALLPAEDARRLGRRGRGRAARRLARRRPRRRPAGRPRGVPDLGLPHRPRPGRAPAAPAPPRHAATHRPRPGRRFPRQRLLRGGRRAHPRRPERAGRGAPGSAGAAVSGRDVVRGDRPGRRRPAGHGAVPPPLRQARPAPHPRKDKSVSEKELGKALLKLDAAGLAAVPDAHQQTWRVLERDRRRVWWLTLATLAAWLFAVALVGLVINV